MMNRKRPKPNTIVQNASRSAEIVASIDDILTQILMKVPIKPLFRSKLVSKRWLSIISSHEFCLIRNPTPNTAQGVFLCIKKYHVYQYEYVPLFRSNSKSFISSINLGFSSAPLSTVILHSCSGLMLCCTSLKWIEIDYVHSQRPVALAETDCKLYVYNPTTNFSVLLPDWPGLPTETDIRLYNKYLFPYSRNRSGVSTTLVFDPVNSPHYKVVLVLFIYSRISSCRILIYSSETNNWSHGGEIGIERRHDLLRSGVYWNGSVHWLNNVFSTRNPKNSIRFHVDTKMFGEMPSPPVVREKHYYSKVYFGESCDHLHFVECTLPRFNVYEMKVDYSEWFVKYIVDFSHFIIDFPSVNYDDPQIYSNVYVLSFIRGESEADSILILRIPENVIKFNLVDGTCEKLRDCVHSNIIDGHYEHDMYGLNYIQSLCNV